MEFEGGAAPLPQEGDDPFGMGSGDSYAPPQPLDDSLASSRSMSLSLSSSVPVSVHVDGPLSIALAGGPQLIRSGRMDL